MKHNYDYAQSIGNAGAQEVPGLKRTGSLSRGRAHRGRDLRSGK